MTSTKWFADIRTLENNSAYLLWGAIKKSPEVTPTSRKRGLENPSQERKQRAGFLVVIATYGQDQWYLFSLSILFPEIHVGIVFFHTEHPSYKAPALGCSVSDYPCRFPCLNWMCPELSPPGTESLGDSSDVDAGFLPLSLVYLGVFGTLIKSSIN